MTFFFSASSAGRLTPSRTASSAQSALRLRSCARPRMYATASFVTFFTMVSSLSLPSLSLPPPPMIETGDAAPRLVPGAIAAMCEA